MASRSFLPLLLLPAVAALAIPTEIPGPDASALAAAASRFLAALPAELRTKVTKPFTDAERLRWNFVPGNYPCVQLRELDDLQRRAFHDLLRAALGSAGYLKTTQIVALEDVLRALEQAAHRDPGRYAVALFGEPSPKLPWAFRFQGHHISWSFTCAGGKVLASTPRFLGANPAEVRSGPHAGLRVLAAEEDLARGLLASLTPAQLERAVIAKEAPRDILLGPDRKADLLGAPKGIAGAELDAPQQALLWRLIEEYARDLQPELAQAQLTRIKTAELAKVHFAWAGGRAAGEAHYYRIHGPTFVIELDNTQNDANHVHTVWRDLTRDFGADVLREHYQEEPHGK
jgi:hypothetical protein